MPRREKHEHEHYISYIFGRIEAQLEGYASSAGLPSGQLAGELGELLLRKAGGPLLGLPDRMPALRRNGSGAGYQTGEGGAPLATVAIHGDAHNGASSPSGPVKHRGRHQWTQAQRDAQSKRMKLKWRKEGAAAFNKAS